MLEESEILACSLKRRKVDPTSDLNSEIDDETLLKETTNEEQELNDENLIEKACEDNLIQEYEEVVEVVTVNNLMEEQIPVVEQPAAKERIPTSRNKRKNLEKSMDTKTMIETIGANLVNTTKSFKRRIIRKVKNRLVLLENMIGKHSNAPLLVDTTKYKETLQVDLPIRNIQEFSTFDEIFSKNPEKIEAMKILMTVATRRSAGIKEAIPNILKTLIGKEVQEGFSVNGKGKNNKAFKLTQTYKTMRDVLLDYFENTSECAILTELSTWLARARDREGGRKRRNSSINNNFNNNSE